MLHETRFFAVTPLRTCSSLAAAASMLRVRPSPSKRCHQNEVTVTIKGWYVAAGELTALTAQHSTAQQQQAVAQCTCARAVRLDESQYQTAPWGSCRAITKRGTVSHSNSSFRFPITHLVTPLPACKSHKLRCCNDHCPCSQPQAVAARQGCRVTDITQLHAYQVQMNHC